MRNYAFLHLHCRKIHPENLSDKFDDISEIIVCIILCYVVNMDLFHITLAE